MLYDIIIYDVVCGVFLAKSPLLNLISYLSQLCHFLSIDTKQKFCRHR